MPPSRKRGKRKHNGGFPSLHESNSMTNFEKYLYKNGKPRPEAPEWIKAKYWRVSIMGYTRKQLSHLSGYSERAIVEHEQPRGKGNEYPADSWLRYRLAMASVAL